MQTIVSHNAWSEDGSGPAGNDYLKEVAELQCRSAAVSVEVWRCGAMAAVNSFPLVTCAVPSTFTRLRVTATIPVTEPISVKCTQQLHSRGRI